MKPKATYDVLSPLNHDQVAYAIGEQVELDDKQAAPLLAAGDIAPVAPVAAESKSAEK